MNRQKDKNTDTQADTRQEQDCQPLLMAKYYPRRMSVQQIFLSVASGYVHRWCFVPVADGRRQAGDGRIR